MYVVIKEDGTMGKDKEPSTPTNKQPAAATQHGQGVPAPQGPKGHAGGKIGCLTQGCKDKDVKFNFCEEHFRQFKFGLITKWVRLFSIMRKNLNTTIVGRKLKRLHNYCRR